VGRLCEALRRTGQVLDAHVEDRLDHRAASGFDHLVNRKPRMLDQFDHGKKAWPFRVKNALTASRSFFDNFALPF